VGAGSVAPGVHPPVHHVQLRSAGCGALIDRVNRERLGLLGNGNCDGLHLRVSQLSGHDVRTADGTCQVPDDSRNVRSCHADHGHILRGTVLVSGTPFRHVVFFVRMTLTNILQLFHCSFLTTYLTHKMQFWAQDQFRDLASWFRFNQSFLHVSFNKVFQITFYYVN